MYYIVTSFILNTAVKNKSTSSPIFKGSELNLHKIQKTGAENQMCKKNNNSVTLPWFAPTLSLFSVTFLPPPKHFWPSPLPQNCARVSSSDSQFPVAVSSADCLCLLWNSVRWLLWKGSRLMPSWRGRTLAASHTALQRAPCHQHHQHQQHKWQQLTPSLLKHQTQHSRKVWYVPSQDICT